ncbi:hypothetical protein [Psychromonas sp. SP041]|uniref:hypothetical protein n=1 Tax=Psychromonas sp. SP041 TaxID=1365007 RepID=UPI00046ED262|nr:hypothetical protein [Psychromonas sp. SP041]
MKFASSLFGAMNSKVGSYFDYLFVLVAIGYSVYGFSISQEAPDFWDWANLFSIPAAILFLFYKPSVLLGKTLGVKEKKRK